MQATHHYKRGDLITYRPFGGNLRIMQVEGREADIKNGKPGAFGFCADAGDVWCYDSQIISVRAQSA